MGGLPIEQYGRLNLSGLGSPTAECGGGDITLILASVLEHLREGKLQSCLACCHGKGAMSRDSNIRDFIPTRLGRSNPTSLGEWLFRTADLGHCYAQITYRKCVANSKEVP